MCSVREAGEVHSTLVHGILEGCVDLGHSQRPAQQDVREQGESTVEVTVLPEGRETGYSERTQRAQRYKCQVGYTEDLGSSVILGNYANQLHEDVHCHVVYSRIERKPHRPPAPPEVHPIILQTPESQCSRPLWPMA